MLGITQDWRCWCCSLTMGSLLIASSQEHVFAQIAPDGTLPNNSIVTTDGSTLNITGGTQAGSNLFHSFSEFSVSPGGTASFNNALDIQNIISRVTGGSVSNIDGIIRTLGTANLFLINPNGIVFGQNAQLNIGGSFVGTTANALQFGNRGLFSATEQNIPSPLLTVNPSALLFNQINQNAAIQNNSVAPTGTNPAGFDAFGLRVPDGKSLLLVGGNVSMNGGELNANGGRVELGGLAQAGSVALGVDGDSLSLRFPDNVARTSVSLTNQAGVFVTGAGGGNIAVNASNLEILEGSILSGGIGQGLGTPETVAGDITLNATGEIKVAGGSVVRNVVRLGSLGNGGNITIDSGSLSLQDGAQLSVLTYGQGNAGNVTVRAKNAVSLADADILSAVESGGIGKGGNIDIFAATLSLIDGAQVAASTYGQGNAGNVTVQARDTVSLTDNAAILSAVESGGVGKGGNIDINAATLSLKNGPQLATLTRGASDTQPAGRGDGGNITIDSGSFWLQNGALVAASTLGQGNAGNVTVQARDAVSLTDARIFSTVEAGGVGKGGNIDINAATLSLIDGASLEASTFGQGNAGNVTLRARDAVSLADARIFSTVQAGGIGKGGNIDIFAATLSLIDGAQLQTTTYGAFDTEPAGRGDAGNVNINVTGIVDIAGEKNGSTSKIGSDVETGTVGNGGNITINSGSLSLQDGAQLSASTFGQGNAGNVTVRAKNAVTLADNAAIFSTVEAGGVGKGGNIDIFAATLSLIDGAQLQTLIRGASDTEPAGRGDAGNVNVNVTGIVDIARGKNGILSGIRSEVKTGTVGNGSNAIL